MDYLTTLNKEHPSTATKSKYDGLSYTYPVKYYDFHIYYYAHNKSSQEESDKLRAKLLEDFKEDGLDGSILVKKLPNSNVIGPHITQFWEVDVARPEVFVRLLSWFQLNHGSLSVLIHPQTGEDLKDHTTRALWLGPQIPIITEVFPENVPAAIPEFGIKGGKRIPVQDFDNHVPTIH